MAGFNPWQTSTGHPDGGILSFATVGSTPASAGASVSGTVATLQPADATHGGVIAASGAQTLAPNLTLSGTVQLNGATTINSSLSVIGGNAISWNAVPGSMLSTAPGPYGTYPFLHGGNANAIVLITSGSGAGETITFPSSVGFPYPTTLAPSGTTQTVDWTIGSSVKIDAASTTGTLVLTLTNPANGGRYIIKTLGKTGRVWTFPASVKWAAGAAPTVTAVNGAIDMFELYYDAGDSIYVGRVLAQNVS